MTPSFESPSRADTVLARVDTSVLGAVIAPAEHEISSYVKAHSERYVRFLETAWRAWTDTGRKHDALPLVWPVRGLRDDIEPFSIDGRLGFYAMDAGAPITATTWDAVRGSADVALTGMDALAAGKITVRSPRAFISTTERRLRPMQPLNLVGPATDLAPLALPRSPGHGGARQHSVLRRHPAAAGVAQPAGDALLDGGIGQHPRIAQRDQNGTLGGLYIARREGKGSKFKRAAAAGTKG